MLILIFLFSFPQNLGQIPTQQPQSQRDRDYVYTENGLQIVVHIWGRVKLPGEYIVPDGTNVLDLISKAGGPDEFADLGKIKLVRKHPKSKRIVKINLKRYLNDRKELKLPALQAGDVVYVYPNLWYKWRKIVSFTSQIAVIVGAYYLIRRGK